MGPPDRFDLAHSALQMWFPRLEAKSRREQSGETGRAGGAKCIWIGGGGGPVANAGAGAGWTRGARS